MLLSAPLLLAACVLSLTASAGGDSTPQQTPATPGAASKRHVRWYMASGAEMDVALNDAFLSDPARRAAITGAYACCNFWMVNASTGALIGDT